MIPRLAAPAVLALLAALLAPTAGLASSVDASAVASPHEATREQAIAAYRAAERAAQVPAGWTGSVRTCTVGSESDASRDATLQTINDLRALTGSAPVRLDPALDRRALAAALMMRAQGDLSHSPGPEWACYSREGADGAGSSNLFLGLSGAAAMVGYVDDAGIGSLGHRRWVLRPTATTFGSGSTGTTNALYVFGEETSIPDGTVVAWPPAGAVATPWVFDDWSAAIGSEGQQVDVSAATVAVTVDDRSVPVTGVEDLGSGYGSGSTLKWRVSLPAAVERGGDHEATVTITGLRLDGAAAAPLSWSTDIVAVTDPVDPDPVDPDPVDPDPVDPDPAVAPAFTRAPSIVRLDRRSAALRSGIRVRATYAVRDAESVRVRWHRDGRAIPGATSATYRVAKADRGHRLAVRVTAVGEGGRRTATSPTRRVAR